MKLEWLSVDVDTFFKWVGYLAALFVVIAGLYKAWQVGIKGFLEALKLWIARIIWRIPKKSLIVLAGRPHELRWQLGKKGDQDAMVIDGHFYVTNITDALVSIPKTYLLAYYWKWGLPRSVRVEGHLSAKHRSSDVYRAAEIRPGVHFDASGVWIIMPPIRKKGEYLKARACMVDQFGNEHWTPIIKWSCF